MKPPQTLNEVQKLNGMINALGRFISFSAKRCLPFYKAIKRDKTFSWDKDCQEAFDSIKKFLGSPPLLSRPEGNEELVMYLAATDEAVGSVLIRETDGEQHPVYYTSKVQKNAELRYPRIEKLALALICATERLRPYFQAHTVIVRTNFPLRKVLQRPESSGRLSVWSVRLGEFDIRFEARKALKAQILADFVTEFAGLEPSPVLKTETWDIFVDGASSQEGAGIGVWIRGPEKIEICYAAKLAFQATNNAAEYEAIIKGLELAKEIGPDRLSLKSDSKLVSNQVNGNYEAKDEGMIKYKAKVNTLLKELEEKGTAWSLDHIPRGENEKADALAKDAASAEGWKTLPCPFEVITHPATELPVRSEPCSLVREVVIGDSLSSRT